METKLIEIRDIGTTIVALCVDMNPDFEYGSAQFPNKFQKAALNRLGFVCDGVPNIMLTNANGGKKATNDYYGWNDRTYFNAHHYITEHWHELKEGDVVDVEFILGEKPTIKTSEITP